MASSTSLISDFAAAPISPSRKIMDFLATSAAVLAVVLVLAPLAGIFGYFIGLSAQYPRSTIKLVTIGWLFAAVLHSLWNVSFYFGDLGFPVFLMKNGPPLLALAACFIKAKRFDGRENNDQRMSQR